MKIFSEPYFHLRLLILALLVWVAIGMLATWSARAGDDHGDTYHATGTGAGTGVGEVGTSTNPYTSSSQGLLPGNWVELNRRSIWRTWVDFKDWFSRLQSKPSYTPAIGTARAGESDGNWSVHSARGYWHGVN